MKIFDIYPAVYKAIKIKNIHEAKIFKNKIKKGKQIAKIISDHCKKLNVKK